MSEKYFKISSAVKNLLGSELITDNFVAVFELVKNSFDARATEVKITFENIYKGDAKIIIQDNGKGMDYDDLNNKWLFLGYSAKRDGSEDYRDKIKSGRVYAGAKGVGRFSADRLGKYLNLITKSEKKNSSIESIFVDWTKFELNQKTLFDSIPVVHKRLTNSKYELEHGTILEITGIPSEFWNRDNFKKLKEKLSKLIRPDLNATEEIQRFKIVLSVPEELDEDKRVKHAKGGPTIQHYYSTINGEIRNFVFNELDIKTTKIEAHVDASGIMTTRLTDRENFIYEIKEKNEFNLLSNISVTLYFLNKSSKDTFKRRTGVEHVEFGSLFVYKNGFRIYPYGERGDDSLGLDNRQTQGYARYLGLRSLMGEISIQDPNPDLRETTSRGDGLLKNKSYSQLANKDDSFLIKTLRRLEKYVIDVTQWGVNNDDENVDLTSQKAIEGLVKLVANISDKNTIDLKYNKDILNLLSLKEEKSAPKLVRNFKRIAAESNNKELFKEAQKIEKAITTSLKRADSAEKERDKNILEKKQVQLELEKKEEQLAIRGSIEAQDLENVTNLHHQVYVVSDNIKAILKEMYNRIVLEKSTLNRDDLVQFMDELIAENKKIESLSRFGMRAIFEDFNSKKKNDISDFLNDYVSKVSNYFKTSNLKVEYTNKSGISIKTPFRPLDISIIVDNMINNAKKHKATLLTIDSLELDDHFEIVFRDNGIGFNDSISDLNEIFKKGYSTTNSTGLGLYHVMNIITDYKWRIEATRSKKKGAEFTINIKK